jgi:hypothetical protein
MRISFLPAAACCCTLKFLRRMKGTIMHNITTFIMLQLLNE